jgi:hypothetical protein
MWPRFVCTEYDIAVRFCEPGNELLGCIKANIYLRGTFDSVLRSFLGNPQYSLLCRGLLAYALQLAYTAHSRMLFKWWIGTYLEGSVRCPVVLLSDMYGSGWGKPQETSVRIKYVRNETRTEHLHNAIPVGYRHAARSIIITYRVLPLQSGNYWASRPVPVAEHVSVQ